MTARKTKETTPTAERLAPGTIALVKFDEWFFGPDGREYIGAFGPVNVVKAKDVLGFDPVRSANWFVQVGYGTKSVSLAGCRIHSFSQPISCPRSTAIFDAS